MVKAKRAVESTGGASKAIIAGVVLVAVAVAGVIGWQVARDDGETAAGPPPATASDDFTQAATPEATPEPTPTPGDTAADEAAAALEACQGSVRAEDAVIETLQTGVGHWQRHVQAQTDANATDISVKEMNGVFAETRALGPDDQKRYAEATKAAEDADAPCDPVEGAPAETATAMEQCQARAEAQQPVLKTGAAAMGDWKQHLSDMEASDRNEVPNPQQVWDEAWQDAPENLDPWTKAEKAFEAPEC